MTELEILQRAAAWASSGRRVALATVIRTWGSSPRPPGSLLAVSDRGEMAGSVSGGCVEAAVVHEAREVIRSGAARAIEYGVADERAWQVGLPCGGRIRVFVEPARDDRLSAAVAALVARERFETVLEVGDGERFNLILDPAVRLVVIGAVHLAQPLVRMAQVAGHDVRLVDPRPALATEDRFPGIAIERGWPEEAFARIGLDARTAVVTLSHDRKLDVPALAAALRSPAFYVGALGSRRTQAELRALLREAGLPERDVDRIHGPVGLDLGGVTQAEIALEILADIVRVLRAADGARGSGDADPSKPPWRRTWRA